MAELNLIRFETTISATPEAVWELMLGAESYPKWSSAFAEGSYYEGSFSQGARVKFLTPTANEGMLTEIAECKPNEFLSMRHIGLVSADGTVDSESETALKYVPAFENYTFQAVEAGTKVIIDQEVSSDFEQYMKDAWPKALESLKNLCEENASG